MLYDSRALRVAEWQEQSEKLISEGWEFNPTFFGVVYIRKSIDGEVNKSSTGWENKLSA